MNFLFKKNKKKLSYKDIVKKINYQLTNNFFSFTDIQSLSFYEIKKIVKLISKIEKIKLSRNEIKEIAIFLKDGVKSKVESAIKLWKFLSLFEEIKTIIKDKWIVVKSLFFIKNYRQDKYDLMLN